MEAHKDLQIRIRAGRLCFRLGILILLLGLLSVLGQVVKYATGHDHLMGFVPLFSVSEESNIPTYFSSLLLLMSAVIACCIGLWSRRHCRPNPIAWLLLSGLLLTMSVDEVAKLHETILGPAGARIIQWLRLGNVGVLYFTWTVGGWIILALTIVVFARWFWNLPMRTRRLVFGAFCLFFGGALGVETISAAYAMEHGWDNLRYELMSTVEEMLEMSGSLTMVYALLDFSAASHLRVIATHSENSPL